VFHTFSVLDNEALCCLVGTNTVSTHSEGSDCRPRAFNLPSGCVFAAVVEPPILAKAPPTIREAILTSASTISTWGPPAPQRAYLNGQQGETSFLLCKRNSMAGHDDKHTHPYHDVKPNTTSRMDADRCCRYDG